MWILPAINFIFQTKRQVIRFPWKSLPPYFRAARLLITRLYHRKRKNILSRHVKIDLVVEEYIKLVPLAKKYPIQAVRSADGILSLVERLGQDRTVLACQITMEYNMLEYNKLESILVNREDEKYHVQMEGQAPELTPKHRNLRSKDYFNSKKHI